MTGAVQAAAGCAAASSVSFAVTIGTDGASVFGFADASNGNYGSISPASFRGATIQIARSGSADIGFLFSGGSTPQFNYVLVQTTSGTFRIYTRASASIANGLCAWGGGTDKVWTSTSPSPRSLAFYL